MEKKSIQNFCRTITMCDFLFILIFTLTQSFAVGVWFGLEIYLFVPMGAWAVAGALIGLLAVILSVGFIAAVLYGAVILWRKREEKKRKIYNCCQIVSIVLALLIVISGTALNISGLQNLWINLFGIVGYTVLTTLNAVGFGLKKRKRRKEKCVREERGMRKESVVRRVGIEGIEGEYAGAVFPMKEDEKIMFGTQPEYCQILFRDPFISRRHCEVCYKAEIERYEIVDHSKNGTFWMDGERLPLGETCICRPGTVFTMENHSQVFRLI